MRIETLFWQKYRPTKINNIILLPRVKKFLNEGIRTNLLFYGSPGTGKTSLARILSKDFDTLELNASNFTSVEVLRGTITEFIKTLNFNYDPNSTKVVFLDEFDGVSQTFQDALKGFIEEYSEYVRFIFTTNHIEKVKEIGSRMNKVNFDPINNEEVEYLKSYYQKYLMAIVKDVKAEDVFTDETISKIVNKFFPDLRASVQMVQEIYISKDISLLSTSSASSYFIEFYNFILNGKNNSIENYKYVMENFLGNPESAFQILGRPFFTYLLEMNQDTIIKKGGAIIKCQKEYNETLSVTVDPIVHLLSYVYDLKTILNKE